MCPRAVAASVDGKRLVTAGADWCVNVWDAQRSGRLLHLGGHIDEARAAYKTASEKAEARNPVKQIAETKLNALGGAQ